MSMLCAERRLQRLSEAADVYRAAYASLIREVSDIQEADIANEVGYKRLNLLVSDVARVSTRSAGRWIAHAEAVAEVVTPTGHRTPARFPAVREALFGSQSGDGSSGDGSGAGSGGGSGDGFGGGSGGESGGGSGDGSGGEAGGGSGDGSSGDRSGGGSGGELGDGAGGGFGGGSGDGSGDGPGGGSGGLDEDQVEAVLRTVRKIPSWAPADTAEIVERHLVELGRTAPAVVMAQHGEALLARIDQEGERPQSEELAAPKNMFRYRLDQAGCMHFTGMIEPETADELSAMLGALAKPAGPGDDRTGGQRQGDAFCDVIHRAIDADEFPTRGGGKPHLNLTMDYTHLLKSVGAATLSAGAPVAAGAARRLACDAGIIPMVMNTASVPLDVGRTHRLVTPAQRTALTERDGGCAFPNCDRPAPWTDAHHITHWLDGGLTDLANMVLLCRRHHRIIHHTEWVVRMTGTGVPEFIPPRWIDPEQQPRRNHLHTRTLTITRARK